MSWGLTISYSLDQFGILNESKELEGKVLSNDACFLQLLCDDPQL